MDGLIADKNATSPHDTPTFKRIRQLLDATKPIKISVPVPGAIEISKSGIHELRFEPRFEMTIDPQKKSVEAELGAYVMLQVYAVIFSHLELRIHGGLICYMVV